MRTRQTRAWLVAAAIALIGDTTGAQLVPKAAPITIAVPGCPSVPGRAASGQETSEIVRRYVTLGYDAELQGDHRTARDVFLQAAALSPNDGSIAYHLARAEQALGDTSSALRDYCRYAILTPSAPDSAELGTQIAQLARQNVVLSSQQLRVAFQSGLANLQRGQLAEAAAQFAIVTRRDSTSAEAFFNRAIALARRGQEYSSEAAQDLERYLALRPAAQDSVAVRVAVGELRGGFRSPVTAGLLGIVPGAGEFYAGNPWRGAFTGALVGSSIWLAEKENRYPIVCPAGGPAPCLSRDKPNYTLGLVLAGTFTALFAMDAAVSLYWSNRKREVPRSFALPRPKLVLGAPSVSWNSGQMQLSMRARF